MGAMKIGIIGLGKIGFPVARNLIESGHEVVGYRRSAMDEFTAIGGRAAASPAEIGADCDIIFSCMPGIDALRAIVEGDGGLLESARKGQIMTELGSHPVAEKEAFVAPLAAKGAIFLDGEVAGTPGMVAARKANIFLSGPREAVERIAPAVKGISDASLYLGEFGGATKVKLANNILVALDIAGAAQAIAFGLKLGVDKELLLKALVTGSGSSTQLGIRGPWMTSRQFLPLQGPAPALKYFLEQAHATAEGTGIKTDIIDCLQGIYDRAIPQIGERDVAALLEYFEGQGATNGANA
jgi:3-hydroxyisobutyrate dehydrogenase-like beta-hydroxyacid dehydrogenase